MTSVLLWIKIGVDTKSSGQSEGYKKYCEQKELRNKILRSCYGFLNRSLYFLWESQYIKTEILLLTYLFFFFSRLDLLLICDTIPALNSWRLNIYSGNNS